MSAPARRAWAFAGAALALVAAALRIHNAFDYPVGKGFDAKANWEYVTLLIGEWQLPDPAALWAGAHPPLFYAMAAAIGRVLGSDDPQRVVPFVRLITSVFGLVAIGLATLLVARADAERPRRAFLAAALLSLLPAHVYVSAMLSEEIVVSLWASAALVLAALDLGRPARDAPAPLRLVAIGAFAGLALLTKLSGAVVILSTTLAYALRGWRRGELVAGLGHAVTIGLVGSFVGGWFFVRNLVVHGYIYPHLLELHAIMEVMPPGERSLSDYLTVPLSTFTTPYLLLPELLGSVWGSTYVTLWFDGHHHFLPRATAELIAWGRNLVILGLLPTVAFFAGAIRGVRRLRDADGGVDLLLLLTAGLSLGGYAFFTVRNPSFVTVKGSYLLIFAVPYAYYASEALADWTAARTLRANFVWGWLALLGGLVIATFWHGLLFAKTDDPGLPWQLVAPRPSVERGAPAQEPRGGFDDAGLRQGPADVGPVGP